MDPISYATTANSRNHGDHLLMVSRCRSSQSRESSHHDGRLCIDLGGCGSVRLSDFEGNRSRVNFLLGLHCAEQRCTHVRVHTCHVASDLHGPHVEVFFSAREHWERREGGRRRGLPRSLWPTSVLSARCALKAARKR